MRCSAVISTLGLVLIFLTSPSAVRALKCAVCLPARHEEGGAALAQEIREQFPGLTLSACPHAEDHSPPTHGPTEVRACPLGSRGCHQQRSGKWTARTCSFLAVDDCQTANGIEYCYCQGDRCNSPHPYTLPAFSFTTTTTRSTSTKSKAPSIVQSIKSSASTGPSATLPLTILLTLVLCQLH